MRRTSVARATKFVGTIGERQVRVIASDATPDRMGDVLDPNGVQLTNFRKNPVVLFGHDQMQPIARCNVAVEGGAVVATIDFPPPGTSDRADEVLRLLKAGILGAVSVGFQPLEWEPIRGAGLRFTKWELLELSVVSVPANPSALVTERSIHRAEETASGNCGRPVGSECGMKDVAECSIHGFGGAGVGDDADAEKRLDRIRRAAAVHQRTAGLATVRLSDDRSPDAYISKTEAEEHVKLLRARHGLKRIDHRIVAAQARYRLWGV